MQTGTCKNAFLYLLVQDIAMKVHCKISDTKTIYTCTKIVKHKFGKRNFKVSRNFLLCPSAAVAIDFTWLTHYINPNTHFALVRKERKKERKKENRNLICTSDLNLHTQILIEESISPIEKNSIN